MRGWFGTPGRCGWRWLWLAIGLGALARLPFLRLPMISDEGGYAYVAHRWLRDSGWLYHDLWVSRPQGILVVYGLTDWLAGPSVLSFRVAAWLACVGTTLAVWRYADAWAGRRPAITSVFGFTMIAAAPSLEGFTANAEVFMALPSALVAVLLLRERERGWRPRALVAIGALAGIATLLKPSGLVMVAVALGFLLLEGQGTLGTAIRRSAWVLTGFGLALLPALLHGWHVGWHDFVFAAVGYRLTGQRSLTSSPAHHLIRLGSLLWHSWWLWLALLLPLLGRRRAVHGRMLAGLPSATLTLPRDALRRDALAMRMRHGGVDPGGTLLRLWLLGCLAGIAMGGDWWAHYLLQAAAPLGIGLAVLARDALAALPPARRLAFATALSGLLLVPYSVLGFNSPPARAVELFHNTGYPIEAEAATYTAAHSTPDDRILVAFNDAAIYYLADRHAAYPLLFNQELLAFPSAEALLVRTISGPARPELIVRTPMPAPFADAGASVWLAVDAHYRIEAHLGDAIIYRAIDEPMRNVRPLIGAT